MTKSKSKVKDLRLKYNSCSVFIAIKLFDVELSGGIRGIDKGLGLGKRSL